MKKLIVGLALGVLVGCGGSGQVLITYHEIDWEGMQALEYSDRARNGYAVWDWASTPQVCDIYLLPKSEYRNVAKYHEVLGHETRHCFEGDFH